MNRNTRRLALVVLLLLDALVFTACQRERPAAEQEGWTTPAAGPAVSPDAMDALSPAVTAVTAGTALPAPGGFVTGTLSTPVAPAALATATPAAAVLQVGATYGYVIKAGDTLFSIALANNTDVETIRRLNNLPDDTIQVGQVLIVPGTGDTVRLEWPTRPGWLYRLWSNTDLVHGAWTPVGTGRWATGASMATNVPAAGPPYYRVGQW